MPDAQDIGKDRQKRRVVETEEFVAFLTRSIDAYGRRVGEDPAAIAYFADLQQRLTDAVNVGLATANKRHGGWSLREIGRYMGVSMVAVHKRVKKGLEVIARREAAAGVVRLADAVKPSIPALREQRAAHFAEIGEQDYRLRLVNQERKSA